VKKLYPIILLFILNFNSCFLIYKNSRKEFDDRIRKEAKQQLNYNKLINIEIEQLDTVRYIEETKFFYSHYLLEIILNIKNITEKDIYIVKNHLIYSFEDQFKPNLSVDYFNHCSRFIGKPDCKFYYYKIPANEKIILDTLHFFNCHENVFLVKELYLTFRWLILNEKLEIISLNNKKNFWNLSTDSVVSNMIILK
jgi:hypothetical protein